MANRTSPGSKKRGGACPQPNAAQGCPAGKAHHCLLMIYRTIYRKVYRTQGGRRPASPRYQARRAPTWMRRGVLAWLVINAKLVLVGLRFGALKVTRLVRLKDSKRTCKYFRSPRLKRFSIDRSRFLVGSRRRLLNCVLKVRRLSAGCAL